MLIFIKGPIGGGEGARRRGRRCSQGGGGCWRFRRVFREGRSSHAHRFTGSESHAHEDEESMKSIHQDNEARTQLMDDDLAH